jgi:hypothetical protein
MGVSYYDVLLPVREPGTGLRDVVAGVGLPYHARKRRCRSWAEGAGPDPRSGPRSSSFGSTRRRQDPVLSVFRLTAANRRRERRRRRGAT